ncbi:MAG: LNS2 domain-containing protein, partial [Promethearchaeia archaeon]
VGRDAKLGQSLQGVSVEVFVNETKTPLVMTVDENYRCTFHGGALRPDATAAKALGRLLLPGRNVVRYQLSGNRALFDIHACIFLWEHTDKLVVCDIDGTVTRSDFLGYSAHLMGYDYTHDGVTDVLNYLHEAGYKILFLTARPITEADRTRHMLQMVGTEASDNGSQRFARLLGLHTNDTVLSLPPGALITTCERWIPAIALSLSTDGPQRFKTSVLNQIQDLFDKSAVFAGGFGNRETDSGAYRATGINPRSSSAKWRVTANTPHTLLCVSGCPSCFQRCDQCQRTRPHDSPCFPRGQMLRHAQLEQSRYRE